MNFSGHYARLPRFHIVSVLQKTSTYASRKNVLLEVIRHWLCSWTEPEEQRWLVLTMSTVTHVWQGALYIIIFGIGTCLGMLLFTTVIGIPFVTTKKQVTLNRCLMQVTGAVRHYIWPLLYV